MYWTLKVVEFYYTNLNKFRKTDQNLIPLTTVLRTDGRQLVVGNLDHYSHTEIRRDYGVKTENKFLTNMTKVQIL